MNKFGGMPYPVSRSHPSGHPDVDPPCTNVVIDGDVVKTGSTCGGNVTPGGCENASALLPSDRLCEADGAVVVLVPIGAKFI